MEVNDTAWMKDAACRGMGPSLFFPTESAVLTPSRLHPKRIMRASEKAKELCQGCSVQVDCLRYAMKEDEVGIWGGTTTLERERIRSKIR